MKTIQLKETNEHGRCVSHCGNTGPFFLVPDLGAMCSDCALEEVGGPVVFVREKNPEALS